jgi:hypothetical protein
MSLECSSRRFAQDALFTRIILLPSYVVVAVVVISVVVVVVVPVRSLRACNSTCTGPVVNVTVTAIVGEASVLLMGASIVHCGTILLTV